MTNDLLRCYRVKKEFEGVAGTASAATAIPSTSTAALQPASGNLFEPSLGTIHDEAGQQSATASAATEAEHANVAKLPSSASTITQPPAQDHEEQLLKMSRKFSQSVSIAETIEVDFDDEDYTPHFQRVYISGDDNTGVRFDSRVALLYFAETT